MSKNGNIDLNDDFWKTFKAEVINKEDKSDPDYSELSGNDGGKGRGESIDWLPWISAGGSALLSHSLASSLFDDDDREKNRSVWYRLLKALFPAGMGALGAWGGYSLAKSMKTAQDKTATPGDTIGVTVGGKPYKIPGHMAGDFRETMEWGRDNGYVDGTPPYVVADDKSSRGWGVGVGKGALSLLSGGAALVPAAKAWSGFFPQTGDFFDEKYTPSNVQDAKNILSRQHAPVYTPGEVTSMKNRLNELNQAMSDRTVLPGDNNNLTKSVGVLRNQVSQIDGALTDYLQNGGNARDPSYKALAGERLDLLRQQNMAELEANTLTDRMAQKYQAEADGLRSRLSNARPTGAELDNAREIVSAVEKGKNRTFAPRKYLGRAWRSGGFKNLGAMSVLGGLSYLLGSSALSDIAKARRAKSLSEALTPPAK